MKIGIIDNYDSFVHNLIRYIQEISNCIVIIQKNDNINFDELETCDVLLLSPGPGIPHEAGQLNDVINKFHSTKKILGICLGHQAIVEFFGGTLIQNDKPVHGKSSIINHTGEHFLFNGISQKFSVGRYHSWTASERDLPPCLKKTAYTDAGEIMAIQHFNLPITGVQFHPESILTPKGRLMIQNWVENNRN